MQGEQCIYSKVKSLSGHLPGQWWEAWIGSMVEAVAEWLEKPPVILSSISAHKCSCSPVRDLCDWLCVSQMLAELMYPSYLFCKTQNPSRGIINFLFTSPAFVMNVLASRCLVPSIFNGFSCSIDSISSSIKFRTDYLSLCTLKHCSNVKYN